jgi:hypothetical protein
MTLAQLMPYPWLGRRRCPSCGQTSCRLTFSSRLPDVLGDTTSVTGKIHWTGRVEAASERDEADRSETSTPVAIWLQTSA